MNGNLGKRKNQVAATNGSTEIWNLWPYSKLPYCSSYQSELSLGVCNTEYFCPLLLIEPFRATSQSQFLSWVLRFMFSLVTLSRVRKCLQWVFSQPRTLEPISDMIYLGIIFSLITEFRSKARTYTFMLICVFSVSLKMLCTTLLRRLLHWLVTCQ